MKKDRKERKENEKGKTEKRCEESQKEHELREREISERINDSFCICDRSLLKAEAIFVSQVAVPLKKCNEQSNLTVK